MGGFPVDFVSQGAIHLPIYVDIQKRMVTFFFYFHCELYIVVDTIQVVQEVRQLFLSMWPDDESVVHISIDMWTTLELIIQKIQSRNKKPLPCGDWNLNFMVNNKKLQELQNLLESYNMMNTVRSPTRITPSTESLIDVIITYKDIPVLSTAVVDSLTTSHKQWK